MDNEGIQVVLAAIVAKFGPFVLTEEELVANNLGVKVWMNELDNTMHIESWDGNESQDQEAE